MNHLTPPETPCDTLGMDNLLTYAKAAEALSVSRATLYRMIDRGDLTPVRLPIGGPRIRQSDLAALTTNTSADTPA